MTSRVGAATEGAQEAKYKSATSAAFQCGFMGRVWLNSLGDIRGCEGTACTDPARMCEF